MDAQPFKIQEIVSKYSLSLDAWLPYILCDLEFNTPLLDCQDGKWLHLGRDKVKSQALLSIVNVCTPQVPPRTYLFSAGNRNENRLATGGALAELSMDKLLSPSLGFAACTTLQLPWQGQTPTPTPLALVDNQVCNVLLRLAEGSPLLCHGVTSAYPHFDCFLAKIPFGGGFLEAFPMQAGQFVSHYQGRQSRGLSAPWSDGDSRQGHGMLPRPAGTAGSLRQEDPCTRRTAVRLVWDARGWNQTFRDDPKSKMLPAILCGEIKEHSLLLTEEKKNVQKLCYGL